jgi:8-oxo-dGTP diphosphatase
MRERFRLSASVFVVVRRGGQVLLLRRAGTDWHDGDYSLPAGGVDGGEALDAAAARELREETGLEVSPDDLRLAHVLHSRAGDGGSEWLGAFFVAERWHGEPRLMEPHKHDALDWFALDALPARTIPYTRQGIEACARGVAFSRFGWLA